MCASIFAFLLVLVRQLKKNIKPEGDASLGNLLTMAKQVLAYDVSFFLFFFFFSFLFFFKTKPPLPLPLSLNPYPYPYPYPYLYHYPQACPAAFEERNRCCLCGAEHVRSRAALPLHQQHHRRSGQGQHPLLRCRALRRGKKNVKNLEKKKKKKIVHTRT